jgi:Tectonin domain
MSLITKTLKHFLCKTNWMFVIGFLILSAQVQAEVTAEFFNRGRNSFLQFDNGKLVLGPQGPKTVWIIEKIGNGNEARIKHQATGNYLHTETSAQIPTIGPIQPGWWSAIWLMEENPEGYTRIKNKWRNTYLQSETNEVVIGASQPGLLGSQWQIMWASSTSLPPVTNRMETIGSEQWGAMGGGAFPDQISFPSEQVVWRINTAGYLNKSRDLGKTWDNLNDKKMANISGISDTTAWGVDYEGNIEWTTDGGMNWRRVPGNLTRISGKGARSAWGVSRTKSIFRTLDGQNWTKIQGAAESVSAISEDIAWVINEGNVWRTNNGGATWAYVTGKMKSIQIRSFDKAIGIDTEGKLKATSNGGQTWENIADGFFHGVSAYANDSAYVIGSDLKLIRVKF